ncbi:MAG TPA: hypothetical protein VF691_01700, partial [Cytophagaceae bacterium]
VNRNAPNSVNIWQTAGGNLAEGTIWAQDKSNGANENNLPGQNGASGRMRGSPWETQIDLCNYLNLDMWINLPVLVDDDYVRNLALLLKQRLKPTLNVNVEIGNELWNFSFPFMSSRYLIQTLGWEYKYGTPEQKKIFGGTLCPGCGLTDTARGTNEYQGLNFEAGRRWVARRLKEHAESFATVFGWREQGGEVGTKIRMVLAGQFYGSHGNGWNIGPGIEFLQKAYGEDAPSKYLYAVAVAPYFGPSASPEKETKDAFINMSVEDVDKRTNLSIDSYFQEFSTTPKTSDSKLVYQGNFLEGLFAKAKMFGLKLFSYEGGNEINTAGVSWDDGQSVAWNHLKNTDAYLSSTNAAAGTKRFFDQWYGWFGYDAMFMKNGDYQSSPMGGYVMSHTLNENLPMRMEYARIANSPAPPLSKERGNVLSGDPVTLLDARKIGGYDSDWENHLGYPVSRYTTVSSSDFSLKSDNSYDSPFIIRCEKGGRYKLSLERGIVNGSLSDDKKWPTYIDIYLNGKLLVSGQNIPVQTISRKIKYDVDGLERTFGFTNEIEIDIPYGVHVLRIKPSVPTAVRPANGGFYGGSSLYTNNLELARYQFKFASGLVPQKPKGIVGDTAVCKNNSKAVYQVSTIDAGVCEYVWSGLPAGATILPNEAATRANPQFSLSGQGTGKIYIDWGSVSTGEYSLKLVAKNSAGLSDALTFKVKVQTCGFEIVSPPVCKGKVTDFKPEPMVGISKYIWDNGEIGKPDRFTTQTDGTPYSHVYATAGTYTVSLKTIDASNKERFYFNTVTVTACGVPIVVSPIEYCKAQVSASLSAVLSGTGTNLRWYTTSIGGQGGSTAPTPSTTVAGTTKYWVSQMNGGAEGERAEIVVKVTDCTITESKETRGKSLLTTYPNPSNGILFLSLSDAGMQSVEVMDVHSKLVKSVDLDFSNPLQELNLSDLNG